MQVSEKLWRIQVSIETLNLKQQKTEEIIQYRNQIIRLKKFFTENVLVIEIKKTQILLNKPVYLGLSVLDLSKTVLYEFRYDYVKPKYGENGKHCYMDTGSFIVHVKPDDIYKDIAEDIEKIFDTSSFEIDRPLQIEKN